jgi:uncharacterized protein YdeI (YjbR/CyaY-like superfamily)
VRGCIDPGEVDIIFQLQSNGVREREGMMDIGEKLQVNSREEWRAWLAEHHQDKLEIWLVLYKSASGQQQLSLRDAQEESICFGWIDSNLKPIDSTSYALRFTPRKQVSRWSDTNKERALRMLREGKMTPAGMALLPPEVIQSWRAEDKG